MIPKLLHFIWIDRCGVPMPEGYAQNISAWERGNPGWEAKLWGWEELTGLVISDYGQFLGTWESLDKAVMWSDLGRLLLCHKFGGIYLDADLKPTPGPRNRLDGFLTGGVIYNKYHRSKRMPQVPSEDYVDLLSFKTILSREHRVIDQAGHGLANTPIICQAEQPWILEFIEQQKDCYKGLVLDFLGPWALTRFWRTRWAKDSKAAMAEMEVVPPHYFLWEGGSMRAQMPSYTLSEHPAGDNTWGDKSRKDWWRV